MKLACDVPTTPSTLTADVPGSLPIDGDKHASDVAESHDAQLHVLPLSAPVTVCAHPPKLSPCNVREPPPLCGTFRTARDTTAVSKLNTASPVPTTPEIVTDPPARATHSLADRHVIDVLDAHVAL